jgi:hypothetical protein
LGIIGCGLKAPVLGYNSVVDFCEHDNEHSDSKKKKTGKSLVFVCYSVRSCTLELATTYYWGNVKLLEASFRSYWCHV